MNFISKCTSFYFRNRRRIDPHLAFLGAYLTTKFIFRRTKAIMGALKLKQVDIANRYGRGTYALITGGAGGIGKEFALDLASKGFNLILADCNEANLEATKQEILQKNTDTLIKTLILDFSKATDPEFYEHFSEEIQAFDISILINNVGVGGTGVFHRMPGQYVMNVFHINLTTQIMVTHTLINKLLERVNQRSLILNMSSASSYKPLPYFFGYGSTKAAFSSFFNALSLELQDNKNIDILTLRPFYVSTAMIRHQKGFFIIAPQQVVQEAWKYVGRENDVTPHWKHQLQKYLTEVIPEWLQKYYTQKSRQQRAESVTRRFEAQQ